MPKPPHVTTGDIFQDLGFDAKTSLELRIKSDLHIGVLKLIRKHGYTPTQVGKILDVPQSRVSELLTGKLSLMSLSKLASYTDRLGAYVKISVQVREKSAA
jgi:predicted XRE-type DNA-binding protein